MNPVLQALNLFQPQQHLTPNSARDQVLNMIKTMNPAQREVLRKSLPTIEKVARAKGVDTTALSELQVHI